MAKPLELAGFWWSGLVCLVLAVLKLTVEAQWSWWRVSLPLWAVLGHNILNIVVGFVWLYSPMTAPQEKQSRSVQGMVGTVTKWRRWCALSCSRITY